MENNEIKELREKQEETLVLVRKLWQAEKWRRFWVIFKYAIFIGIIVGAFYFLTPYVEKFSNLILQFQSVKSPQELQIFLQQLQK
ncbi:hypothetical protein HY838_01480 [Candidatus Azambacteria bacterium]|nr:hypothetical protein [Candidatus Azambacteria bacterium]